MMTEAYWLQLGIAFVLMIFAGLTAAAEAALSSFSKARANRLLEEGRPGAQRVRRIVDDPPQYLNTLLFLRSMIEISAIILVANVIFSLIPKTWQAGAVTSGIMIIVSYIAWGVAPRTLGRQHADRIACAAAGPIVAITTVLGPFPRLLILIGNALTPGKGFTRGAVRYRGGAARAGRPGRGQRGDRVWRAQDDSLGLRPGRHDCPRGDGAAYRHGLHRGVQDPAAGRLVGAAVRLQPDPGHPRRDRRRRGGAVSQGRDQTDLRQAGRAVHRAGRLR